MTLRVSPCFAYIYVFVPFFLVLCCLLFFVTHHFHIDHNASCLPSKILHNHCLQFLLGITVVPREIEDNGYAKFWGRGGKQGALWSIHKVCPLFSNYKSSLIIPLPASLSNGSIFGITFLSIPATVYVALAVKLDAEVFVADITGHLCALI